AVEGQRQRGRELRVGDLSLLAGELDDRRRARADDQNARALLGDRRDVAALVLVWRALPWREGRRELPFERDHEREGAHLLAHLPALVGAQIDGVAAHAPALLRRLGEHVTRHAL